MTIVPPYLQPGHTIGIVCPAGYMPAEKAETCINTLQQWGFNVKTGTTLGRQFHYFSGTDEERAADLQEMMDDPSVHAILCGRGGYGVSRIIDRLRFDSFVRHPKWVVGFSDITVLHAHLLSQFQVASLHAPMAAAFNDGGAEGVYVQSLRRALTGEPMDYTCAPHAFNREGQASGRLVGGNLSLLAHLVGSRSDISYDGCLLFMEDIGEYIYNVDRMLWQLERAGKLQHLAGLIVGGFTDMKDTTIPFGREVYELVRERVEGYGYPVCYGFPVSHGEENYALKHGLPYSLRVTAAGVQLTEMPVTAV